MIQPGAIPPQSALPDAGIQLTRTGTYFFDEAELTAALSSASAEEVVAQVAAEPMRGKVTHQNQAWQRALRAQIKDKDIFISRPQQCRCGGDCAPWLVHCEVPRTQGPRSLRL